MIRRTDDTVRRGRRSVIGIVAPGGTGDLFVRPFRAIVTFRAQETPVLFDGCGCSRDCGPETNVAPGADIANQPVRVGPVSTRWALSFENGWGCEVVLAAENKNRPNQPGKAFSIIGAYGGGAFMSVRPHFSRKLYFSVPLPMRPTCRFLWVLLHFFA